MGERGTESRSGMNACLVELSNGIERIVVEDVVRWSNVGFLACSCFAELNMRVTIGCFIVLEKTPRLRG
jgi:hypothetical protein